MKAKQSTITVIEYLEATDFLELARLVNVAIEQGWQPFDGTRHYKKASKAIIFIQAVVKYSTP